MGAKLTQAHLQPIATTKATSAQEVILQIDGGHVPTKDPEKRSFEALSAVAYRPENIIEVDSHHRQIKVKSCALSAQDDDLTIMKTYTLNATRKQGMTENTRVTALADGAQNCWSVILSLAPHCKKFLCILDWFHIAMRFQNVRGAVDDAFTETLEGVKWKLWHGKSDEALQKLELLMTNITDEKKRSKLKKLYNYLENNQVYLVNYKERDQQGLRICVTSGSCPLLVMLK